MGTEQTRTVVEHYYAALAKGDREGVRALLTDDCVWVPPPGAPIEPITGGDALTKEMTGTLVKRMFDLSQPFKLEVRKLVADGDTAVVQQRLTATARETGAAYDNQYCWVYTVTDGRISHMEEYADTLIASKAFGWSG